MTEDASQREIRAAFERYRMPLGDEQAARFARFLALMEHWNRSINLTAIRDRRTAILRHLVEPAMAERVLEGSGPRILDVGSGPGVPGIPLQIMDPERQVTLVESNQKKATFLHEVAEALELPQIVVVGERLEDALGDGRLEGPYHVVTARAWTGWGPMIGAVARVMAPGARAVFFVGDETLREMRRHLPTGTTVANPTDPRWVAAARAEWSIRRVDALPHLDRTHLITLQLPSE